MAIPVARVHLKVAHAALPALLPAPPKWKMLPPLLSTPPCPCPCVATGAIFPNALAKKSRADSDERWDACKTTKPVASAEPSASSSSGPRSTYSITGHGSSSRRKNVASPRPKPGRADSVERWDAHKQAASPASSSSSSLSGSGTSPLVSSTSSKWRISHATSSADHWDVHKERRPPQADHQPDDGESSNTTGSGNDIDRDTEEEEEILWKPRAMYAGPGFAVAAPESSVLPMPTALFIVPVA